MKQNQKVAKWEINSLADIMQIEAKDEFQIDLFIDELP